MSSKLVLRRKRFSTGDRCLAAMVPISMSAMVVAILLEQSLRNISKASSGTATKIRVGGGDPCDAAMVPILMFAMVAATPMGRSLRSFSPDCKIVIMTMKIGLAGVATN